MNKTELITSSINIGGALEHFREESKLSKSEFASKGGFSTSHYSEVISGKKNISLPKLKEFCRQFGIPFHLFVFIAMEKIKDKNNSTVEYIELMRKSVEDIQQVGLAINMDKSISDNNSSKECANKPISEDLVDGANQSNKPQKFVFNFAL